MQSRLTFVVGCWRSGTTWINRCLASHPDVLGVPETHVFGWAGPPSTAAADQSRRALFWQLLDDADLLTGSGTAGHPSHDPRPRAMERQLLELMGTLRRQALIALRDDLADQASWEHVARTIFAILDGIRPMIVEKTPGNVLHLKAIKETFPDARIIAVVRDPRDVLSSVRAFDKPWTRAIQDPEYVAKYWATCLHRIRSAQQAWPDDVALVRYEDLIARFEPTFASLLQFLDLGCESINSIRDQNRFESYTGRASGMEVKGSFYRKGVAGGFVDDLSTDDIQLMERRLETLLASMGYPCVASPFVDAHQNG